LKILIIRNDYIGDLILTSCVFREIKKHNKNIKIVALVSELNKDIIKYNPYVDKIIISTPFWRKKTIKSFIEYIKVLYKIRKEKFDIGIDIKSSWLNKIFFLYFGRIKKRVAYSEHPMNKNDNFLTDAIEFDASIHASQSDLNLANHILGIKSNNNFPEIFVSKKDKLKVKKYIKKINNKFICICPDSNSDKKQWYLDNYTEIIRYLLKEYPKYDIILIGKDIKKLDYIYESVNNTKLKVYSNHNLREVFILMGLSSLVISPDGGMMHLAWASKSKLIAMIPDYLSVEHIAPRGNKRKIRVIYKDIKKIKPIEVKRLCNNLIGGKKL
jgi:heptosyltransferase-2